MHEFNLNFDMSPNIERKLAAIMFTDIAGYTALSAKDEDTALKLLDQQKKIFNPIIKEYKGTLHKEIGDGLLYTFPTVTYAIECGIKIQKNTKSIDLLNIRIGIHEGEITLKNGDALGDDVNVASRIESFGPIGGISISGKVQQNISSLPKYEVKYLGEPTLKGVNQDVKIFCIVSHGMPMGEIIKVNNNQSSYSNKSIILISTLFGILFFMNIYPVIDDMLFNNNSINQSSLIPNKELFIDNNHTQEVMNRIDELENYFLKQDLESNLESLSIAEELLIDNPNQSDFYSYLGMIYFQRYKLNNSRSNQLLIESKEKFIQSVSLNNLTRKPAVIAYYYLASIYLIDGNIVESYSMIKKAMQIDKSYPGVKNKLKEINRKRLKGMES